MNRDQDSATAGTREAVDGFTGDGFFASATAADVPPVVTMPMKDNVGCDDNSALRDVTLEQKAA